MFSRAKKPANATPEGPDPADPKRPGVMPFANVNPPIRAQAYTTQRALQDMANPGSFKANPTLAAGDFKVSKDGGAFVNLTNLPAVTPAASVSVQFNLTATEMDADVVMVTCIDQTSPKEWSDYAITIETASTGGGGGGSGGGGKVLEI